MTLGTVLFDTQTRQILSLSSGATMIKGLPNGKEINDQQLLDKISRFFVKGQTATYFLLETSLFFTSDFNDVVESPNVEAIKQNKISQLRSQCEMACISGLITSVLGEPYHYSTHLIDQQNVNTAMLVAMNAELPLNWTTVVWCKKPNDDLSWALMPHNKTQVQALGKAYLDHIQAQRIKLAKLSMVINAANDVATIKTTFWG